MAWYSKLLKRKVNKAHSKITEECRAKLLCPSLILLANSQIIKIRFIS